MRRFAVYLALQLKRALALLPRILVIALLLAAAAVTAGLMLSRLQSDDTSRHPAHIGLVGDENLGGLANAVSALGEVDVSRFSLSLEPMTLQEAKDGLGRGYLVAYAVIPDDFVSAMMVGDHHPATFYFRDNDSGLGSLLMREVTQSISALVLDTENAVYGAQNYVADHIPGQDPYAAGDRLTAQYTLRILDRGLLFDVQTTGAAGTLSLAGYYLCGILVLFVMLWAISCCPLLTGRSRELGGLLWADGLKPAGQVLAEYVAFAAVLLGGAACAALAGGTAARALDLHIPELAARSDAGLWLAGLRVLPPALMLCAMSYLLYELTENAVAGVLLVFFNAVVQGYLAGCFYPAAFFPDVLRPVSALLPAGVAMDALQGALGGRPTPWTVWAYTLIFLFLSVLIRARRLCGGKGAAS